MFQGRWSKTGWASPARWTVQGAEAVLRIRALIASNDWNAYYRFHLRKEHARNDPPVKATA